MAPELKSEREKVHRFGEHLLHPTLCIKPFVLLLFRCPLGTVLLMSLHPDATPREKDRSRSLRRVEKMMASELMDAVKLVVNELKGCLVKLVRNELMGCTKKGRFESQITAPWCGSRVAGWRVAAGKKQLSW